MNKTTTLINRIAGYNKGRPSAWRGRWLVKTAAVLFWLCALLPLQAQIDLTLSADNTTVTCGETVTVSVDISAYTNLAGLSFSIAFDPAVLDFVSATGEIDNEPAFNIGEPGVGPPADRVTYSWLSTNFLGGSTGGTETVLEIVFTMLDGSSTTMVSIVGDPTDIEATDGNTFLEIPVNLLPAPDGEITIMGADPIISINSAGMFPFNTVCVGEQAAFLASPAAAGVETYTWTFGGSPTVVPQGQTANDGVTKRRQGATYDFSDLGSQTVDLTVLFTNGCTATAPQHTITVEAPEDPIGPVVKDFCADETDNAPRLLSVQGLADPDLISVWTIGANPAGYAPGTEFTPGNGDANLFLSNTTRRSIRVEGPAPTGTYEFCVKIRNTVTGCESMEVCGFSITKNEVPSDAFRPAGTAVVSPFTANLDFDADHDICPGDEATYGTVANTAGINTVSWSISGGGTILEGANARNVKVQWDTPGTYTLTFDVTNIATGCTSTNSLQVTVLEAPAITINSFGMNPFNEVCVGDEARFLASPEAAGPPAVQTYTWAFSGTPVLTDNGQVAADATTFRNQGATYGLADVGPQTVDLTVEYTNGCVVTAPQHTITVNATAAPTADKLTAEYCVPEPDNDPKQIRVVEPTADEQVIWVLTSAPAGSTVFDGSGTQEFGVGTVNSEFRVTGGFNGSRLTMRQAANDGTIYGTWTFDAKLVNTVTGCESPALTGFTATALEAPAVTIDAFGMNPFNEVCVGDEARFLASATAAGPPAVQAYTWAFSGTPAVVQYGQAAADGTTFRNQGATYTNGDAGMQTVDLMVEYTNGCVVTAPQHTITVNLLPVMTCPADLSVCLDDADFDLTTLSPTPDPAGGTFSGTGVSGDMFSPGTAGVGTHTITYEFTDANGCTSSCTFDITVNANPSDAFRTAGTSVSFPFTADLDYDADHFICGGEEATYGTAANTAGVNTVAWSISGGGTILEGANDRNVKVEWTDPGTHTLTFVVTNVATGCQSTNSLQVTVDGDAPVIVCQDITVELDANGEYFMDNDEAVVSITDACPYVGPFTVGGPTARMFDCDDAGQTFPRTVTATDGAGNMGTCDYNVTVEDNMAPVITCQDITVELDSTGAYTIANDEALLTISDNCGFNGPFTVGGPTARMFDCDDAGQTFSRTMVSDDPSGNQGSCTYNVTVEDNMAPVITCQDITVELDSTGAYTIANDEALLTISDNCGFNGPFTVGGPTARMFDCDDAGQTFSRTMVSDDPSGNQGSCTYNVTVEDNMAPVITCQDITVELDSTGAYTIANDEALLTISDNCDFNGPFTSGGPTARMFDCDDAGQTFSRTMVSTDPSGNTGSCTYNVTVEDNLAPTPPAAPAAEVYQCADDVPAPGDLTATDNCGDITVTGMDTDNGGSGCLGDPLFITRTWTFDDGNGNAVSISQIITVEDDTKPIFQKANVPDATFMTSAGATCPTTADISLVADQSNPIATGNAAFSFTVHGINVDGPTVYTDNCSSGSDLELYVWNIIEDFEGPATNCERKIQVIYRVYDACGNFQQRQQTFTILNDVVPTATAPADLTLQCAAEVDKPEDVSVTFTSGCAGPSDVFAMDTDNGGSGCMGDPLIITRTWTFDDGCGNIGSVSQTITVEDDTAPVIECPSDLSESTDPGQCTWTSEAGDLTPTAVDDNCGVASVSYTIELPSAAPSTPTPMAIASWGFEDAAKRATNLPYTADGGNAANQDVATVEIVGASFTAFVNGSGGAGTAAPNTNTWTAVGDNYWQATLSTAGHENLTLSSKQQGSNTGPRNFEVEYSLDGAIWVAVPGSSITVANNFISGVLTDVALPPACNNQATLFLRWRNVDDVAVNGGTIASAGTNRIDDIVVTGQAISGGGGMTITGMGDASGTVFPLGTSVVTYEVTDFCGNTSTCSFNVTVADNEAPTIECPATQSVVLDDNCEAVLPDYTGLATTNDNCGVEFVEQSPVAGTVVSGVGMETIELTVTDSSGNTASCTFMVDKLDQTPPTLVCLTNTVFLNPDGEYTLVDTDVLDFANSFDNCSAVITVTGISPDFFTCDDLDETFTVEVTAEDASGNSATCDATITIDQGTALPAPWQETTLGTGTGDAIFQPCDNGGEFTLTSNTRLFPMDTDNYEYVYQELCGDITITAQITQFAPNGWQGLFIRNAGPSNTAGLAYRVQGNTTTMPSSLAQAHLRQTNGGNLELSQFNTFVQPYWVRIVSTPYIPGGRLVQLYASPNGTNWTLAQSRIVSGLNNCVEVGLILQSQDLNTTVEAKFANVEATGTAPTPLQGPNSPTVQQQSTVRTAEIFPNPASSYVTLSFSHPLDADAPYILRNQMGQAVLRGTLNAGEFSTELNVGQLAAGMYSIEVLTGSSEREVLRFIKQ